MTRRAEQAIAAGDRVVLHGGTWCLQRTGQQLDIARVRIALHARNLRLVPAGDGLPLPAARPADLSQTWTVQRGRAPRSGPAGIPDPPDFSPRAQESRS